MPRLRKATWALVMWNVLMLLWFARLTAQLDDFSCSGETGGFGLAACQWGASIGLNYGVVVLIIVWLVGLATLGLVWLFSRPQARAAG